MLDAKGVGAGVAELTHRQGGAQDAAALASAAPAPRDKAPDAVDYADMDEDLREEAPPQYAAPVVDGPEGNRYRQAALAPTLAAGNAEDDYDVEDAATAAAPDAAAVVAPEDETADAEQQDAAVHLNLPAWALAAAAAAGGGAMTGHATAPEVRFVRAAARLEASTRHEADNASVSSEEPVDDDDGDAMPVQQPRRVPQPVVPAASKGGDKAEQMEVAGMHHAAAFSLVHQTAWEARVMWDADGGAQQAPEAAAWESEDEETGSAVGIQPCPYRAHRKGSLLPAPPSAQALPRVPSQDIAPQLAAPTPTTGTDLANPWGEWRAASSAAADAQKAKHPQMLRFQPDVRPAVIPATGMPPPPPPPAAATNAAAPVADAGGPSTAIVPAVSNELARMLPGRNAALWMRGDWSTPVLDDSEEASQQRPVRPVPLLLDLNDPDMTFALNPTKDKGGNTQQMQQLGVHLAAATVLPPALAKYAPPRRRAGGDGVEALEGGGGMGNELAGRSSAPALHGNIDAQAMLAPLKVSLDDVYAARGNDAVVVHRNAMQRPPPLPVAHALPALKLETAPSYLSPKEARRWHQPRARMSASDVMPSAPKGVVQLSNRTGGGHITVFVTTLREEQGDELSLAIHPNAPVSKLCADIAARWPEHIAYRALVHHHHHHHSSSDAPESPLKWPFLLFPAKRSSSEQPPAPLAFDQSLAEQGCDTDGRMLVLVATRLVALPTRIANAVPGADRPRAPPAAFQGVEDLTLRDGHLWVVEYSEQHPLLMSNPAMGARRVCWYRKTGPDDELPKKVKAAAWGADIQMLEHNGGSPFIGNIAPGKHMLSLETRMSRSPVFEHPPLHSDFIVARTRTGALLLRSAHRTAVVGHIEPHALGKVPAPKQNEILSFHERRLKHAIFQKLRKLRAEGKDEFVNIRELKLEFPYHGWEARGTGIVNASSALVKSVKALIRSEKLGSDKWRLLPGIDIPSEESLRQLIAPEAVCCYESMQAGRERLKEVGIMGVGIVNPKTNMFTAVAQLPRTPENRSICAMIALELSLAPWSQTTTLLDVLAGRATLRLDTSRQAVARRGHVIHYVRKTQRHPADLDERRAQVLAMQPKRINGTEADLRKLSLDECAAELRKLGLQDAEISPLTRWQRVRLIRDLSAAAVQDGGRLRVTQSKFVRLEREGAKFMQRTQKESATKLLERMSRMYSISEDEHSDEDEMEMQDEGEGEEVEAGADGGAADGDGAPVEPPAAAPQPAAPAPAAPPADADADDESDLDSDEEDFAQELEAAMLAQAHAGAAKAAAARIAAEEAAMAEEAEERRQVAELHGLLFENGVAADGGAAPAVPLAPPPPGCEGKTLRLRRKLTICHPGGRIEDQESVITDPAVIAAYMRAKTSGGDVVAAVLQAQGPDGKLPFPLKGSFVQSKKRYMKPELKERRDREKEKKMLKRAEAAKERQEKLKARGLDVNVIQEGTVGQGGLLTVVGGGYDEGKILKLTMLNKIGKTLASGLKEKIVKPSRLKNKTGVFNDIHIPRGKPGRKTWAWKDEGEAAVDDADEDEEEGDGGGKAAGGSRKRPRATSESPEGGAKKLRGASNKPKSQKAAMEAARAEGRTADVALYVLNAALREIFDEVVKGEYYDTFYEPLSSERSAGRAVHVPDYNDFVAKEDMMCGRDIRSRCNAFNADRLYPTVDAFLADVHRMAVNARAYNLPGPYGEPAGEQAIPGIAQLAEQLEEDIRTAVDARSAELQAAAEGNAADDGRTPTAATHTAATGEANDDATGGVAH